MLTTTPLQHDGSELTTLLRVLDTDGLDSALSALHKMPVEQRTRYNSLARVFACRCVRETPIGRGHTVWELLVDERLRHGVVVAEEHARGEATDEDLLVAYREACVAVEGLSWTEYAGCLAEAAICNATAVTADVIAVADGAARSVVRAAAWHMSEVAATSAVEGKPLGEAWNLAWNMARSKGWAEGWHAAVAAQTLIFREIFGSNTCSPAS